MAHPRLAIPARGLLIALLAALAFPGAAGAHGPVAPIASSYLARVTSVPAGLDAKVVDADQRMWLRVATGASVIVLDYRGAPYLRFSRGGVEVNRNSAMYYLNQTPVAETPPAGLSARTPPNWLRVSGGNEYGWHDGRLHALAAVALAPGASFVGNWRIPVLVDGRSSAIAGGLWHAPAPSIVWFWPIAVLLLCVLAAWRVRSLPLDALVARVLAVAALLAVATAAAGRQLHGRPSVSVFQLIELGLIAAFVAWAMHRMLLGRPGYFTFFVVAFAALYEGVVLIPTLLHGFVLMAVPAFVARACAVVCLGAGVGLLFLVFRLAEQPATQVVGALAIVAIFSSGCGAMSGSGIPRQLLGQARPIGRGPGFHPPVAGAVVGRCRSRLDARNGVHVEVFAQDRVVIVPGGIGTRPPRAFAAGRISHAACYGDVVTLEPTGVVLVRRGARRMLSDLFRSWGEPLTEQQLASFTAPAGTSVTAFVDGRRWRGSPGTVPLAAHSEIVLEVGPHVPPHPSYTFPPGA
jgi:hypothetical protein